MVTTRCGVLLFAVMAPLWASGCIRSYCEARGVSGRLIDADTGKSLGGVAATVTIDKHTTKVVSSPDGHFNAKPRYRPALWIGGDWAWPPPAVEIAAKGYEVYRAPEGEETLRQQKDYVLLGDVPLKRAAAPSSGKQGRVP